MDKFFIKNLNHEIMVFGDNFTYLNKMKKTELRETIVLLKEQELLLKDKISELEKKLNNKS